MNSESNIDIIDCDVDELFFIKVTIKSLNNLF